MKPAKPHHYYRIPASTPTGIALQSLIDKCDEASETARQWAEAHGATSYYESPEGIAGGIVLLIFPDANIPEGFEATNDSLSTEEGRGEALPLEGSDLEQQMFSLPIVSETEFVNILKFRPRISSKGKPLPFTFGNTTPVCFLQSDFWYVDMPYECQAEGIGLISEKEFYRRRLAAVNSQK